MKNTSDSMVFRDIWVKVEDEALVVRKQFGIYMKIYPFMCLSSIEQRVILRWYERRHLLKNRT